MEVPRLAVESELQLLAYTTATAVPDLSCVCDLHHSSWQHQILNPLGENRDWTCILMDTSRVCNLLSHNGNSQNSQQHQILNPLSKARDQTHILMNTSLVLNLLSHNRNSWFLTSNKWKNRSLNFPWFPFHLKETQGLGEQTCGC